MSGTYFHLMLDEHADQIFDERCSQPGVVKRIPFSAVMEVQASGLFDANTEDES
jgi:hypothetical protein